MESIKICPFCGGEAEIHKHYPPFGRRVRTTIESETDGTLKGWMPWYCSECGCGVGKHQTTFCPNCGADMRGEHDGYFDAVWNFDVIAWMPLPEPYKGEEHGEG